MATQILLFSCLEKGRRNLDKNPRKLSNKLTTRLMLNILMYLEWVAVRVWSGQILRIVQKRDKSSVRTKKCLKIIIIRTYFSERKEVTKYLHKHQSNFRKSQNTFWSLKPLNTTKTNHSKNG